MDAEKYFKSDPPTYQNGSTFLGFRVPAAQTFTSYSPSSDINAYMQALTGLGGYKQRSFLQSPYGTQVLSEGVSGQSSNSVSYLGFPGYHSKAACQTDSDCGDQQICYAFNEQVFGPQQGPTCSPTVYPEILLGNSANNGKPLRQNSNYCYTDEDCQGIDKFTGKKKVGMSCNHYYKGPSIYEKNGLCQVQYENGGRRYHLKTPPGWVWPLNQKLKECNVQSDCGVTGINGWTRCVGGSADGKKYCVWPGQTGTPSPRELQKQVPRGIRPEPAPTLSQPSPLQSQVLNVEANNASRINSQMPGGNLTNTSVPPMKPSSFHLLTTGNSNPESVPVAAGNMKPFK